MSKLHGVNSQNSGARPGADGWSISISRKAGSLPEDLPAAQETDRVNEPGRGCKDGGSLQRFGGHLNPFRRGRQFLRMLPSRSEVGNVDLFAPQETSPRQEFPHCDSEDPDEEPVGRPRLLGRQDQGKDASVRLDESQEGSPAASGPFASGPINRLKDWFGRHIVSRQVFIRTDGRVRFFTITRSMQYVGLGFGGVAALIFLSAGGALVVQEHRLAIRDLAIQEQQIAYDDLLGEVGEYHRAFSRISQNLEDNQANLLALLENDMGGNDLGAEALPPDADARSDALNARIQAVRGVLAKAQSDRARLDSARAALGERLALTEDRLADSDRRVAELEQDLAARDSDILRLKTQTEAQALSLSHAESRVASLEENLSVAARHETQLTSTIASKDENLKEARELQAALQSDFSKRFEMLQSDYLSRTVALQGEVTQLQTYSGQLETHLDDLTSKHLVAVSRMEEDTQEVLSTIEHTVAMTGLDLESLVPEEQAEENTARGGPFVTEEPVDDPSASSQLELALGLLDLKVERWRELQELLRAMPLAAPLENYVVTSSFGTRVDPINGRKAVHQGVDFRGQIGTSVYSTAPGTVVYAGRKGQFGNFIEIDHGYGIHSRYAHLNQILVKVGEAVTNRQKIGNLGTTGRSTGPHVHYEISFNGVKQDPAKFLTAGKNVFKD